MTASECLRNRPLAIGNQKVGAVWQGVMVQKVSKGELERGGMENALGLSLLFEKGEDLGRGGGCKNLAALRLIYDIL